MRVLEDEADTAAIVAKGTAPLSARVAAALANMHGEVLSQARVEAYRIRLMVITMTVLAAGFGIALLGPGRQPA